MAEITLPSGDALSFDDEDAPLVAAHTWHIQRGGRNRYAVTTIDGRPMALHRLIIGDVPGKVIDHRDGNGLNNQRANLRHVRHADNIKNQKKRLRTRSRFKGVSWSGGRWEASIRANGERLYLGKFDSEERAARQFDRAARLFHGSFAKTNEALGLFEGPAPTVTAPRQIRPKVPPSAEAGFVSEMRRVGIGVKMAGSWARV